MLIASKEIDVVFTIDGQEYITRKHLVTEVKNECIGQGGLFYKTNQESRRERGGDPNFGCFYFVVFVFFVFVIVLDYLNHSFCYCVG